MFTATEDVFELTGVLPVTKSELSRIKTRNSGWVDFIFM
jgi:hypothetical protein